MVESVKNVAQFLISVFTSAMIDVIVKDEQIGPPPSKGES
jgi:hypothetical protein